MSRTTKIRSTRTLELYGFNRADVKMTTLLAARRFGGGRRSTAGISFSMLCVLLQRVDPLPIQEGQCAEVRRDKFLLSPTHNGLGNQYMGWEKALWLSYSLNRTLVSPPLLRHQGELAFNSWPHCGPKEAEAFAGRALLAYDRITAKKGVSSSWSAIFDVSQLATSGMRVIDYAALTAKQKKGAVGAWRIACDATRGSDDRRLSQLVPNDDASLIVVGSAFRMDLKTLHAALQRAGSCSQALLSKARCLPLEAPFRRIGEQVANTIQPYLSVHLRTGDHHGKRSNNVVAAVHKKIEIELMRKRASSQLPDLRSIFISYDLKSSFNVFSTLLLCRVKSCVGRDMVLGTNNSLLNDTASPGLQRNLVSRYGSEVVGLALDQEIAAKADVLILTDGSEVTFRRTSTFGMILRRRWAAYHPRSGNVTL